jgi:hypothetical protein
MPISNRQLNEPNTYHLNIINNTLTTNLGPMQSNIGLLVDNSIINNSNLSTIASDTTNILVDTSNLTVQLDNLTRIAGIDNYSENISSGLSVLPAVRTDTLGSLVSSNKDLTFLQVNSNGALYVDIIKIPAIGSQGNLSDAITTIGTNEKSSVVNTIYSPNISIFGNCSDNCTITLQTSIDNVNFYDTSYDYNVPGSGSDFYINALSAGQYHRLNYSASNVTITATLCAV